MAEVLQQGFSQMNLYTKLNIAQHEAGGGKVRLKVIVYAVLV